MAATTETPGFCKTEELANLFGCSGQWILQLKRDGVIRYRDTPAGKRFNVVESTRAYIHYLRDKAAGRDKSDTDPESDEAKKLNAEMRIKEAKATRAELETKELQGKMHRSEDVAAMTEDLIFTIRDALVSLPGRMAVDVSAVNTPAEASEIIRREVNAVMEELSRYRYDPEWYAERVRERLKWEHDRETSEDEDAD